MENNNTAPTWETIKSYFEQQDKDCMDDYGIDLWDCASVRDNGEAIYAKVTKTGPGGMPPQADRKWTLPQNQYKITNFRAWLDAGAKCD